jgi:glycosyltransferase involved in cell wall biosynthesis
MPLTILSVAYPLVPVSENTAGGAEQILAILDRHLVRRGVRSLVIAARGSRVQGQLIPTPDWDGIIDGEARKWAAMEHRRTLDRALREFQVDAVHLHGLDFSEYLPAPPVPCVATLHLPPEWYAERTFDTPRPNLEFVCVSDHQRRKCPPSLTPLSTIPLGIDVETFDAPLRKRHYVAAVGRVCPEKGFHFAIGAAQKAGVPLIIAGEVFPYVAHQRYFREKIAPCLGPGVRFIGPVGFRKKRRLLSSARCLLIGSTAPETSSLVAMETLACGTPVVAFGSGALPEIIEHGRTGFIVENEKEMAEAIDSVAGLDPRDCRESARMRFSAPRMVQDYFRLYSRLIAGTRTSRLPEPLIGQRSAV